MADQAIPLHLYALGPPEVRLGEQPGERFPRARRWRC